MKKIKILDSTLRDGAQGQGISFSVADKIKIIKALDFFGVDHIEAGYPASNPKDEELFENLEEALIMADLGVETSVYIIAYAEQK